MNRMDTLRRKLLSELLARIGIVGADAAALVAEDDRAVMRRVTEEAAGGNADAARLLFELVGAVPGDTSWDAVRAAVDKMLAEDATQQKRGTTA
jgi:hypothetical protein